VVGKVGAMEVVVEAGEGGEEEEKGAWEGEKGGGMVGVKVGALEAERRRWLWRRRRGAGWRW